MQSLVLNTRIAYFCSGLPDFKMLHRCINSASKVPGIKFKISNTVQVQIVEVLWTPASWWRTYCLKRKITTVLLQLKRRTKAAVLGYGSRAAVRLLAAMIRFFGCWEYRFLTWNFCTVPSGFARLCGRSMHTRSPRAYFPAFEHIYLTATRYISIPKRSFFNDLSTERGQKKSRQK